MSDTTVDIENKITQMISRRSPVERLKMASSMFESGKKLIVAGLLKKNPFLNNAQIRAKTFSRIYNDSFSRDEIAIIVRKIPDMKLDPDFN